MNYSDFKCKACGGSGTTATTVYKGDRDYAKCPCKRTATETIPLVVPDGYEFNCITKGYVYFKSLDHKKYYPIKHKELPNKIGDTKTFVCEVCGGEGVKLNPNNQLDAYKYPCPQCKGKPEIHATVTDIRVEKAVCINCCVYRTDCWSEDGCHDVDCYENGCPLTEEERDELPRCVECNGTGKQGHNLLIDWSE